ncbi:hypothetical protein PTKIN_Ptkin16aG0071300 [Pterospermum kingtungense]
MDEILWPDKAWLHKLGSDQFSDSCLYHKNDDMFSLDLQASESEKLMFIASERIMAKFVFYLDVFKLEERLRVLTSWTNGIDTSVSHRRNHFFFQRKSDELFNSEQLTCLADNKFATRALIPYKENVKIQGIECFSDHLVHYEREQGLPKIIAYRLPAVEEPLKSLQSGQAVQYIGPVYSVDYDMNIRELVLKKIETVLGGFDATNYVTEKKWATTSDGTPIPKSVVYQKNLVKLYGSDPMLLHSYGSYEICIDPNFKATRLSLLDRGFIFTIAHIHGSGVMGRQWYENGKFLKKKNTFTDFIAYAEFLIEKNSKEQLCIEGRSAWLFN